MTSPLEQAVDEGRVRVDKDGSFYEVTSWAAVDLEPYKRGERVIEPPAFLMRDDGRALIYPGRPHVFYGASESLKSWAALFACKSVLGAGFTALYIDFEGSEASFVERARFLGIADGAIGGTLRYVRPTGPVVGDPLARADFEHELRSVTGLVVLDGVTECYSLHGWNINAAEDAAKYQAAFAFDGAASISIDHTPKDAGRGVVGSQHKRAGLDGAEYEFRSRQARGRGGESIAEVLVTKDRHGFVREWAESKVGSLHVGPEAVSFVKPTLSDLLDPKSDAQDRFLEAVRETPGSSFRAAKDKAGLGDEQAREARDALEFLGKIRNSGTARRQAWEVIPAEDTTD